jgi:hypothetical protein
VSPPSRPPGMPEMPEIPRPGMPPDMSGGGITGMPGGPGRIGPGGIGRLPRPGGGTTTVIEYRCERCGYFLGTGPAAEAIPRCPGCGAVFTGTRIEGGGPGTTAPPITTPPPSTPTPPEFPRPTFPPPEQYQPVTSPALPATVPSPVNWSRAGLTVGILTVVGVGCIIALFVAGFIYRQSRTSARRYRRYY